MVTESSIRKFTLTCSTDCDCRRKSLCGSGPTMVDLRNVLEKFDFLDARGSRDGTSLCCTQGLFLGARENLTDEVPTMNGKSVSEEDNSNDDARVPRPDEV